MNDLQKLFLKDNPVRIITKIFELQNGNGRVFTLERISEETGIEKANVSRQAFRMEDRYGLIESERSGREKYLGLTTEGRKVAENLDNLIEACQQ